MNPSPSDKTADRTCIAIGADAGGTKIAIAWSDGDQTYTISAPSMNLRVSTPAEFAAHVGSHIRAGLGEVPLDPVVRVCLGAAGAGTPMIAEALRRELAVDLSIRDDQIMVVADAHVALRAGFPEGQGILVIAGTGSGCYALDREGGMIRAGGWGPGLEDPGSGSELGRSAVKHLLSRLESGTSDALSRRVAEAMGLPRPTISGVLDAYYRSDYHASSLAPAILDLFESGDPDAGQLIRQQCEALAKQCHRLMQALGSEADPRVAVAGGLSNRDSYIRSLSEAINKAAPETVVTRLQQAPVSGALAWALAERGPVASTP